MELVSLLNNLTIDFNNLSLLIAYKPENEKSVMDAVIKYNNGCPYTLMSKLCVEPIEYIGTSLK